MFCYCFYQYVTFAKLTMSSQCDDECHHYFLTNFPHFYFLCSPELNFLFIPRKFIQLNLWDLENLSLLWREFESKPDLSSVDLHLWRKMN